MTTFAIKNFGCRVNQAEAFAWAETLTRHGFRLERRPERAEIVIVNTCTLTGKADRDGRKFIRHLKRMNPDVELVLTGCSVEVNRAAFERSFPSCLVLTNQEKESLPEKVTAGVLRQAEEPGPAFRARALLKVQDGCNSHCTFCIIPRVRGRSRSLGREEVLARSRELVRQGFKEIVLCGIHLSSYGQDLNPPGSLLDLLREVTALPGLGKIRLSSLDPTLLEEDLIDFLTGNPKICPHFHLSLQHGSDRILRLMGRKSKVADYRRILSSLRQRFPEAAIGADIIVGFPEEREEDFEATWDFVEASPLTYLHVFSYSPRPGTPAALWPQLPEEVKRARSARLRRLSQTKRHLFQSAFLGREVEGILVRKEKGGAEVLTGNYMKVRVPECPGQPGEMVRIRITRVESGVIQGEIGL